MPLVVRMAAADRAQTTLQLLVQPVVQFVLFGEQVVLSLQPIPATYNL
jgi:hypothetical protein